MTANAGLDRWLRARAYDVLARRDHLAGWRRARREFRAMLKLSPDEAAVESLGKLQRIVTAAYASVPYYRDAWQQAGVGPEDVRSFADLTRFPMLGKDLLKGNKEALRSREFPTQALDVDYTGGTTGTQTSFYRNHACTVARVGRQWGVLESLGYPVGTRRAMIWGVHSDLPPRGNLKAQFREYAGAAEVLCCTVMTAEDLNEFYERVRKFSPRVLYGYPSPLCEFARFVLERKLPRIAVDRIFCTAENLTSSARTLLTTAFDGEVFNLFCSRENGCVAFECHEHDGLHVDTGSVHVEIIVDGRPAGPGESGEIVLTDLLNEGMPFVRYATGDRATAASHPCPCGLPLPTIGSLDGRIADVLHLPNGSAVAGLMLTDLFWEIPAITAAQFVQNDRQSLDVNLVIAKEVRLADLADQVTREVRTIMGPDTVIRLHALDDLPRNPRSGKFQEVVSRTPAPPPTELFGA